MDPVPDPQLLRKSGSAGNRTRDLDIMFIRFFFVEIRAVYEIIWKTYYRAGQAADDNMAHAHSVLHI